MIWIVCAYDFLNILKLTCDLTSNSGTEADRLTDGAGDPSQMIEIINTDWMFLDLSIIASTDINSPY